MLAMPNGTICGVVIKRSSRSLKRQRLYRGMIAAAAKVLQQQTPGLVATHLHIALKEQLGLYDDLKTPGGRVIRTYRSTAFGKMDEATFAAFVTAADGVLSGWIGCPPGAVFDEARAMLG